MMKRMKKSIFPGRCRPSSTGGRLTGLTRRFGVVLLLWLAWGGVRAATDERSGQQYAPSRFFDILHYQLDVTPDFAQRRIEGVATLKFKPVGQPLDEVRLDAIELRVNELTSSGKLLGWQSSTSQIIVTFETPVPVGKETELVIRYQATPTNGLFFRTPELGYKASDTHLFSQGEAITARNWYPCYDAPNAKFTSEIVCHVPEGMVALSNGRLVSEEKDPRTGLVAFRWLQDKPHSTYLMALAAGYFMKIDERQGNVPLAFYTPASQIALARGSFEGTAEMVAFFEKETGVPYPWAKYYQVCVDDFVAGGMENTSLTILTGHTLHTPEFENLRDSQGLVAHELAHQWFGDFVTCKDWANLWLNEGFATYYEELYEGHRHGPEALLYRMFESAESIARQAGDTNAIVRRDFSHPDDQFSYRAYGKGGWVLHMLRNQLGEDLYRRCIKTYLERHQYGLVVTEDLNRVIEELSGQSFDRFFDQWVYHPSLPQLEVGYEWNERTKTARVSVQQTQKNPGALPLFHFPLPVRFVSKTGVTERKMAVRQASEDFSFSLAEAPEIVRIDPEVTVLAAVRFTPPRAMLERQLTNTTDAIGRILAVRALSGKRDALKPLEQALNQDAFYGVRVAASAALRAINTDEAWRALTRAVAQPDARVRAQVVRDLASYHGELSRQTLMEIARKEPNPEIRAAATSALGAYVAPEIETLLRQNLRSSSFQQVLAGAAIEAMRGQDDEKYAAALLDLLKENQESFAVHAYARALDTLGFLCRHQDNKTPTREFLLGLIDHKREAIQVGAIQALGTLGDPKALATLQSLARGPRQAPERGAAERAVNALRNQEKPANEFGALRQEFQELQKNLETLRKEHDELKAKGQNPPTNSVAKPTPAPAKPTGQRATNKTEVVKSPKAAGAR